MTALKGTLVMLNSEWMVHRVFDSGFEKYIRVHSCSKPFLDQHGIEGEIVNFTMLAESMPRTVNGFVPRAVIKTESID